MVIQSLSNNMTSSIVSSIVLLSKSIEMSDRFEFYRLLIENVIQFQMPIQFQVSLLYLIGI